LDSSCAESFLFQIPHNQQELLIKMTSVSLYSQTFCHVKIGSNSCG
jgi:hypothetical protein